MHNLKVENHVLFVDFPRTSIWGGEVGGRQLLSSEGCSEEVREEPGYIGVFATKPR